MTLKRAPVSMIRVADAWSQSPRYVGWCHTRHGCNLLKF